MRVLSFACALLAVKSCCCGPRTVKVSSFLAIMVALWTSYHRHRTRCEIRDTAVELDKVDFEHKIGFSIGECDHPLLFRNVINYNDESQCQGGQGIEDDQCGEFIKQRMLDLWKNRLIEALPPDHSSDHAHSAYYESKAMTLDDYFNDPQYKDYLIHTLHQLGNREEYQRFLSFDGKFSWNVNYTSGDGYGAEYADEYEYGDGYDSDFDYNIYDVNIYEVFENIVESVPLGTQFFISQKKGSGSTLHFGLNVFLMLAGRKRWLIVNPAYLDDANCAMGMTGIYGDCIPNGYLPLHVNISIDKYKDILINQLKIPPNAIVDVTLSPGDVLVNCPLWAHTIENLDDITIAYSFRATMKKKLNSLVWLEKFLAAMYQSLKTKLWHNDWSKLTLLDGVWIKIKNGGKDKEGFLDEDTRFEGNSIINSKHDDKEERVKQGV